MSSQPVETIAQRFDAEIDRRDLTNQQVAWALGVSEKSVVRWRKGIVTPRTRARQNVLAWIAQPEDVAA